METTPRWDRSAHIFRRLRITSLNVSETIVIDANHALTPILEKRLIARCNRVLIDEIDAFVGHAGAARLRPKEDSR